MLKVGQIEQVEITGYSSEGMGVCRMEGCAVFVPNAIRGEVCRVRVTHVSKNSAHGKIEEILERSPHRVRRACEEAKVCGGCQLPNTGVGCREVCRQLVSIRRLDGVIRSTDSDTLRQ